MKAIVFDHPGDESVLHLGEVGSPELGANDLRLRVLATAVNRADLMQRRGMYPPPPGASPILGLECSGEVVEIGRDVRGWKTGERAMALLAGGGYAEEVVVDAGSAMPVPASFSDEEAGAFPEVFLTSFLNVFQLGKVPDGGSILVHGGGSGIGTSATTLGKAAGLEVIVTAGSAEKCAKCLEHGADVAIDYRAGDWVPQVLEATGGKGVNVVLDSIGGSYLAQNQAAVAMNGSIVLIGLMGGARAEIDLASLLLKRVSIHGSTLRARPVAEKARIVAGLRERFGTRIAAGTIRPVVHEVLPLAEAGRAHALVASSEHFGKVVLRVAP